MLCDISSKLDAVCRTPNLMTGETAHSSRSSFSLSKCKNLHEIDQPLPHITVTKNGEGAIVLCKICNNYIKNGKPSVNLVRSLGHSFASGLALDRESYAAYGKGLNSDHTPDKKMFANFKQSLSLHHEMLLHEEAMKFEVIHEKKLNAISQSKQEYCYACIAQCQIKSCCPSISKSSFYCFVSWCWYWWYWSLCVSINIATMFW